MNKLIQLCMVLFVLNGPKAFAGNIDSAVYHQSGFFLGLGESYNSVKFKLDYSARGVGDVFDETETLVATGEAGGPGAPFSETETTFAPVVQLGYINHGCDCNFWGIKYQYQYLDITSTDKLLDTPQAGFLDPVGGAPEVFTGNVITKSAQTKINHEMILLAFMGQSLGCANVYLGVGPCAFEIESHIYQAFGFANLNGLPREATGEPVSFSSSKWVWGGAAQLGLNYMFNRCWFLDLNYTYTITENYHDHYSAPYTTSLVGGYTNTGTLFIKTKRQIRAQALNVTINRWF